MLCAARRSLEIQRCEFIAITYPKLFVYVRVEEMNSLCFMREKDSYSSFLRRLFEFFPPLSFSTTVFPLYMMKNSGKVPCTAVKVYSIYASLRLFAGHVLVCSLGNACKSVCLSQLHLIFPLEGTSFSTRCGDEGFFPDFYSSRPPKIFAQLSDKRVSKCAFHMHAFCFSPRGIIKHLMRGKYIYLRDAFYSPARGNEIQWGFSNHLALVCGVFPRFFSSDK